MKCRRKNIPSFKSFKEEAKFWDKHDITDYKDQLNPVQAKFSKHLSQGITVRFDPKTLYLIRAQAKEKGLGPTTLIRLWVMENIHA